MIALGNRGDSPPGLMVVAADETLTALRGRLAPDLPGTARMIEVARLRAGAPVALADFFAAATAAAHGLVLLAGDPELVELVDSPCVVEDLAFRDLASHCSADRASVETGNDPDDQRLDARKGRFWERSSSRGSLRPTMARAFR